MASPVPDGEVAVAAQPLLTLDEGDIDGAYLPEPLDKHTVEQLRWWLLCHGCKYQTGDRKIKLIEM